MDQKKINIVLVVCVIALSIVCFRQSKQISSIEDSIHSLDKDVSKQEYAIGSLENEIDSLKSKVDSLQDDISPSYSYTPSKPSKSWEQKKQEVIEKIERFNAEREKEKEQGIINSDPKVANERYNLNISKKLFNIDIVIY